MNPFPEHTYARRETVYRDGVAGKVIRRLWLIDQADRMKPAQPAYEVQFTDGRILILEENELSSD
jgi:hypothetical protein